MLSRRIAGRMKTLILSRLKSTFFIAYAFCLVTALICSAPSFFCDDKRIQVPGSIYEMNGAGKLTISDETRKEDGKPAGIFSITGELNEIDSVEERPSYDVYQGNISFTYEQSILAYGAKSDEWHLVTSNSRTVNGVGLGKEIKSGALIVQTSLDGETWLTDLKLTDVLNVKKNLTKDFYASKSLQLVNGCYYRVMIAYKLARLRKDKKILFVDADEYDYKDCIELFEFYMVNCRENEKSASSSNTTPRKEVGHKTKVKLGTGFYNEQVIGNKDPHYGWDLGKFIINGYTRETKDDEGNMVFLKNAGNKVTLWFHLDQNIEKLNGKNGVSISKDIDGYDIRFEVPKTNFGRGALVIQFTDYEGKKTNPIIYTDFLSACSTTSADTKAVLFEEGDYEVALDYEIEDASGRIGPINTPPVYTNYRIAFRFSVRNGNCMVMPFDLATGSELADGSITENGFRLDMAKSRYLTIDVTKKVLKKTTDGWIEDVRFNRPAVDGEEYTEEGIYVFDVTNKYTGQHTTKTIYVGSDQVYGELSKKAYIKVENNN